MSDSHELEGYVLCREHGNHYVTEDVARRTGGLCSEAWREKQGKRSDAIELVMRGRRLQVPLRRHRPAKPKKRSPEQVRRRKEGERAKDAARKRLAAMFPDMFDTLLAEERAARGLEPWPTGIAIRGGTPDQDLEFAELAADLTAEGIDPT